MQNLKQCTNKIVKTIRYRLARRLGLPAALLRARRLLTEQATQHSAGSRQSEPAIKAGHHDA